MGPLPEEIFTPPPLLLLLPKPQPASTTRAASGRLASRGLHLNELIRTFNSFNPPNTLHFLGAESRRRQTKF
jgi:hypothetical protein